MITIDLKNPQRLPLELLPGGKEFELKEATRINIGSESCALWVEIPAGYTTDFASIPREAALFGFDKLGKHSYAALAHDWMFARQAGFELANAALYNMLRASDVPRWKSVIMMFCCETGGKSKYLKCAKK